VSGDTRTARQPEGDNLLESRGDGLPSRMGGNAGQLHVGTAGEGTGRWRSAVVHDRP
jgi:hypothetical protein